MIDVRDLEDDPDDDVVPPLPVLAKALEKAAGKAFLMANREGQLARSSLYGLSMSALGGCPRQAAYRFSLTEPSNPEYALNQQARAAMIGVAIHEMILPRMAAVLGGSVYERRVTLSVDVGGGGVAEVPGSLDLYTPAFGGGVIDWKTLYAFSLGKITEHGATDQHRKQVRGYATAMRRMGFSVRWLAWMYMDRSTGDVVAVVEPFGLDDVVEIEGLVLDIVRWSRDPDRAPRGNRGPGVTLDCDSCPWLNRCWGPDARPGDTKALARHDDPGIAEAARRYAELRDEQARIKKEMDYWSAVLDRPAMGVYGDMEVVYGKSSTRLNQKRAEALLKEMGVPEEEYRDPVKGSRIVRYAKEKESEGDG